MFTGIIEEVGRVEDIKKGVRSSILTISGNLIFSDLSLGHSVAVNGVCLTVRSFFENSFTADVMQETLSRSSLGNLKRGSHVNLERAMAANGRFGGHIVSGHIDGIGEITRIEKDDNATWYTIKTSSHIIRYIVEKGSIAIDGISLTVVQVSEKDFRVSIIPHTKKETILVERSVGDKVNLENDLVGKYIEKLINPIDIQKEESKITKEFLRKFGY